MGVVLAAAAPQGVVYVVRHFDFSSSSDVGVAEKSGSNDEQVCGDMWPRCMRCGEQACIHGARHNQPIQTVRHAGGLSTNL